MPDANLGRMGHDAQAPSWVLDGALASAIVEAAQAANIAIVVTFVDEARPRNAFVGKAMSEMLGYTVEELLEREPLENVVPEERPRLLARFEARTKGAPEQVTYEVTQVHKSGTRLPTEVTVSLVRFNGRPATIAFITDITERKRADEALRSSEASFRQLIEIAPEAFGIWRDGNMLYANAAYVKMLGYETTAELQGRPLADFVHPDDHALLRARIARIEGGGERMPAHVYRVFRRDGSVLLLEANSVVFDYQGQRAVLAIGRDVTERKRMESQLVQADRLAAMGTLAAGVAHEVNNPLAYLLLNLEWLARQIPLLAEHPGRTPEILTMLEEARHGAERVGAIVRELRAFSRADDETRRMVDLPAAVHAAIKIAAHELRPRGRVITAFEEVPPVWANEARLEQVLLNLLLNAAQALPERDADTNEIRIALRPGDSGQVIVEVSDNGVGIPPDSIRRIFDPFFTTKPLGVGTGLGLSICHSIVTSLGGQISVQSQVGEGTTFRLSLPTRGVPGCPASVPAPTSEDLAATRTRRGRVLVIDDEIAIANALRDLLASDHDATAVSSARRALEMVDAGQVFDVIFCDLMMPGMSGMELHERLGREHPGLEARMVFMTGGAFTPRAAEFLTRVTNRRLEKPFALSAVEAIVRDATRGAQGAPEQVA